MAADLRIVEAKLDQDLPRVLAELRRADRMRPPRLPLARPGNFAYRAPRLAVPQVLKLAASPGLSRDRTARRSLPGA